MEIKRLYHHWSKWEDYEAGFYDNISGKEKSTMIEKVVEMFSSRELTSKYMDMAITKWYYSCEQNLTNNGMNKIAYIGQAACCLYANIPSLVTMEGWSSVSDENKEVANQIALEKLKKWEGLQNKMVKQKSMDNKC